MRPPQVALDFGTPPGPPSATSSDEFERVPYPEEHTNWAATSHQEEELPLHYMNEEKARRRVRGPGAGGEYAGMAPMESGMEYDDEGKDVYAKIRPTKGRVGSGRLRRPTPPPPTSVVSVQL